MAGQNQVKTETARMAPNQDQDHGRSRPSQDWSSPVLVQTHAEVSIYIYIYI